jgi:hypothetical protein
MYVWLRAIPPWQNCPKERPPPFSHRRRFALVAFKVYDMDRDGFISNGELFLVLKMMVGNNLKVPLSALRFLSLVDD